MRTSLPVEVTEIQSTHFQGWFKSATGTNYMFVLAISEELLKQLSDSEVKPGDRLQVSMTLTENQGELRSGELLKFKVLPKNPMAALRKLNLGAPSLDSEDQQPPYLSKRTG